MYEEAVQDFEKAKELDPNSKDIEHQLRQAKIELKRSKRKDYYKILDCPRHFTSSELKKKYHKAALKWHPGFYLCSVFLFSLCSPFNSETVFCFFFFF